MYIKKYTVLICLSLFHITQGFDYSIRFIPATFPSVDEHFDCENCLVNAQKARSLEDVAAMLWLYNMPFIEQTIQTRDLEQTLKYNFYAYTYFVTYKGFVFTDDMKQQFPCLYALLLRWEKDCKNEELPPLR